MTVALVLLPPPPLGNASCWSDLAHMHPGHSEGLYPLTAWRAQRSTRYPWLQRPAVLFRGARQVYPASQTQWLTFWSKLERTRCVAWAVQARRRAPGSAVTSRTPCRPAVVAAVGRPVQTARANEASSKADIVQSVIKDSRGKRKKKIVENSGKGGMQEILRPPTLGNWRARACASVSPLCFDTHRSAESSLPRRVRYATENLL